MIRYFGLCGRIMNGTCSAYAGEYYMMVSIVSGKIRTACGADKYGQKIAGSDCSEKWKGLPPYPDWTPAVLDDKDMLLDEGI